MTPVHGIPLGRVGIVLEEGMVLTPVDAEAIGIVHPTRLGLKMMGKAQEKHSLHNDYDSIRIFSKSNRDRTSQLSPSNS